MFFLALTFGRGSGMQICTIISPTGKVRHLRPLISQDENATFRYRFVAKEPLNIPTTEHRIRNGGN